MDDAERKALHDRLDAILDRRAELDPTPSEPSPLGGLLGIPWHSDYGHVDYSDAREVFSWMISLACEALGEPIRRAAFRRLYGDDADQRAVVRSWLDELWPLLHVPPQTVTASAPLLELTVFDLLNAISALDAGEIRPLFLANTGRNRRANRWSLAQTKLQALAWKKRLLALGYAEKAANFEITKAFQEQWDTIRKWKSQCEQILGMGHVVGTLAFAGSPSDYHMTPRSGIFGAIKPDPLQALQSAGDSYRAELIRSAELSKRKSRGADR